MPRRRLHRPGAGPQELAPWTTQSLAHASADPTRAALHDSATSSVSPLGASRDLPANVGAVRRLVGFPERPVGRCTHPATIARMRLTRTRHGCASSMLTDAGPCKRSRTSAELAERSSIASLRSSVSSSAIEASLAEVVTSGPKTQRGRVESQIGTTPPAGSRLPERFGTETSGLARTAVSSASGGGIISTFTTSTATS